MNDRRSGGGGGLWKWPSDQVLVVRTVIASQRGRGTVGNASLGKIGTSATWPLGHFSLPRQAERESEPAGATTGPAGSAAAFSAPARSTARAQVSRS